MSPVGFRLKELREKAGLSQSQLAIKAGVRQATISDLEGGKTRRLLEVIDKLSAALKVEPGDLLHRVSSTKRGRR